MLTINIINKIKTISNKNTLCILEDSNTNSIHSFQAVDVMMFDWTCATYEDTFRLLKLVLFIDIPLKIVEKGYGTKRIWKCMLKQSRICFFYGEF